MPSFLEVRHAGLRRTSSHMFVASAVLLQTNWLRQGSSSCSQVGKSVGRQGCTEARQTSRWSRVWSPFSLQKQRWSDLNVTLRGCAVHCLCSVTSRRKMEGRSGFTHDPPLEFLTFPICTRPQWRNMMLSFQV